MLRLIIQPYGMCKPQKTQQGKDQLDAQGLLWVWEPHVNHFLPPERCCSILIPANLSRSMMKTLVWLQPAAGRGKEYIQPVFAASHFSPQSLAAAQTCQVPILTPTTALWQILITEKGSSFLTVTYVRWRNKWADRFPHPLFFPRVNIIPMIDPAKQQQSWEKWSLILNWWKSAQLNQLW